MASTQSNSCRAFGGMQNPQGNTPTASSKAASGPAVVTSRRSLGKTERSIDMFANPLKKLRQSTWLSAIPDTVAVPAIGDRPARTIAIERATIDDIAFALLPLNRERSALTQTIVALEEIASMARKQGAAGTDIAVSAAARE